MPRFVYGGQRTFMLQVHAQKLGDVIILCLQGRIGIGETAVLRNAVHSQSGVSAVVLDLARVIGIDAGGLGVMLELREQTRSNGIDFRLMNVTKPVQQVLEITRLSSVFEIFSEAEVLSRATQGRPAAEIQMAHCG